MVMHSLTVFGPFLVLVTAAAATIDHPRSALVASSKLFEKLQQQREELVHTDLSLFRFRGDAALPSPGAAYEGTMNMPVIGRQTFRVQFLTQNNARITLTGKINLDEPADYSPDVEEGGALRKWKDGSITLLMDFNEPTVQVLRSWNTKIRATRYTNDGDYATLVIKPPLIPAISVKLHKQ